MLREDYYIHISGYIIQDLQLRGYDAMCFGLIESFSQAKMGYFKGGQDEIAYALGVSRKTANEILGRLEARNLIEKSVVYNEKERKKETVITSKVTKGYNTKVTILPDQSNESLQTYNKEDNNIDTNIPPLYPPKGETPQESISKNKKSAKAKPSVTDAPLVLPFSEHKVVEAWYELCKMPKWRNKPQSAIEKALKKLSEYSDDVVLAAIEDAIMGNYQGIFPDKFVKKVPLAPQPPKPKYVDIKDIM